MYYCFILACPCLIFWLTPLFVTPIVYTIESTMSNKILKNYEDLLARPEAVQLELCSSLSDVLYRLPLQYNLFTKLSALHHCGADTPILFQRHKYSANTLYSSFCDDSFRRMVVVYAGLIYGVSVLLSPHVPLQYRVGQEVVSLFPLFLRD